MLRIAGGSWLSLFAALACVALMGCGGEKLSPPKTAGELTEQEKQQVRELNEQRASEWGPAKKK